MSVPAGEVWNLADGPRYPYGKKSPLLVVREEGESTSETLEIVRKTYGEASLSSA